MATSLNRIWRVIATGLGYTVFGFGVLSMAFLWFPILRLWPGTKEDKIARVQRSIHNSSKRFLRFLSFLGVCRVEAQYTSHANASKGQLLVANHPSLLDVVLVLSVVPRLDCIVKASAWQNPFLRGLLRAADYIPNDDPMALIDACVDRLEAGRTILIFPEGTRSEPGRLQKLKRGAAAVAVKSGCTLTPVTIRCTPTTLTKAERWYEVPPTCFTLQMEVDDPIDIDAIVGDCRNHLLAYRKLTQHLQHHFMRTGPYHGIA